MNKIPDAVKWVLRSPEASRFRRLWVRAMLSPGFDLVLVALVVLALCSNAIAADSSACYAIGDSDQRVYCLAKSHRDSGRCYAIQNAGLRQQCLAEVRR